MVADGIIIKIQDKICHVTYMKKRKEKNEGEKNQEREGKYLKSIFSKITDCTYKSSSKYDRQTISRFKINGKLNTDIMGYTRPSNNIFFIQK